MALLPKLNKLKRTLKKNAPGTVNGQSAVTKGHSLRIGRMMQIALVPIFFGCFFIFLLRYIDPAVIYSSNGINIHNYVALMHAPDASSYTDLLYRNLYILELTPEYLREVVLTPGGWTRFAVTLSLYLCHTPFAGALVITGLALFFCWIFTLYIIGCGARRPFVLGFVPAFFILTICAWYELSFFAYLLPIAGALGFAVCYQRLRPATRVTTVLRLSGFLWLAWYLVQWGYLPLLLFVVIRELLGRKHGIAPVAMAAVGNGVLIFIVDTWVLPLNMTIRWSDFTMFSGLPLVVIGFFPLTAIILAALGKFRPTPVGEAKAGGSIVPALLLVCGTATAALWLYKEPVNRDTRTIARTVHHVMNGQWDAVLQEKTASFFTGFPQKSGTLQVFMLQVVNHALCRSGQLGDRMFTFPQAVFSYDPLIMLQSMNIHGYLNWLVVLDLAMDLGMVNAAEKIAGELMENMGPYPDIIYRRALVQIAMGNRDAAAVYLGKLAFMPYYRAQAKRLLNMLDSDGELLSEPRIAAMRANRDTIDYFLNNNLSCDLMLKFLLQSNHGNKAAYDYLMTDCLLYDRLDELAVLAPAASAFGYAVLPRYWEEALCLYQSRKMLQTSSGLSFDGLRQETVDRFLSFTNAWAPIQHDPGAAAKLAPVYGDSYFFYSIFRYSPGVSHE